MTALWSNKRWKLQPETSMRQTKVATHQGQHCIAVRKHKFEFHGPHHSGQRFPGSFPPALALTGSCSYAAFESRCPKHRCLPAGPELRPPVVIP